MREDEKREGIPLRENAQQWRGHEFAGENRVGKTQEKFLCMKIVSGQMGSA